MSLIKIVPGENMKIKNLLKTYRNWCKKHNEYLGRHCLNGAANACYTDFNELKVAKHALRVTIRQLFPEFTSISDFDAGMLMAFNDDPKIMFKDVRKVILKAKV
jgi:hypothetical protein